ncbi:hypothetical protein AC578_8071 [Pseudocercospora eumusae]|uniref:Histone-lysine N-methyltransferase, H3 lysine-79 specific n=1 Tax=Pseudocercospora eumusae TaxID=321146 RepID=A0A139H7R2_9PEZI|nr:hypothetical protein AC578_8071 [Pseudocercospora eumusae]
MSAPHGYNLRPFIISTTKIYDGERIKPRHTSFSLSPAANENSLSAPLDLTPDSVVPASQKDVALRRLEEIVSSMPAPASKTTTLRQRRSVHKTRPREVVARLELHHSADNHDASAWDVDLKYPLGLAERFAFGRRTYRKDHRYARQLDPFEDLVNTISVLLEGTGGCRKSICSALRQAWKGHENWTSAGGVQTFQNTIGALNVLTGHERHRRLTLTPDFLEHFFDQLHDRVIADNCAELLHRTSAKSTENVYGELRPRFLSRIFNHVGLNSKSIYLDLGSGVGQTAMQASLQTQCEAHGIERERRVHALAQYHLTQFRARAELYELPYSHVVLRQGDFLTSRYVRELLSVVHVVLLNNLKLDAETDVKVCDMLEEHLKEGAKVVSTRTLRSLKRGWEDVGVKTMDGWRVERLMYEAESVSWSGRAGEYFVSTRLKG